MDSDDDYEFNVETVVPVEKDHIKEYERKRSNSPSSSENGDNYDDPPVLSPIHALDIPSVRRPPVSVMVPADRVSTHDLPLAETLSVVERGLFHNINAIIVVNINAYTMHRLPSPIYIEYICLSNYYRL